VPSPHRKRLSRDVIVTAALDLLEEDGIDKLSMRAIAARLDCEAMSLYRYVANKEALLGLAAERVVAEIRLPDRRLAWEDAICELMRELRRVALRHPTAFQLVIRRPIVAVGARPLEAGMQVLLRGGFDVSRAATVLCACLAYATGAIGNELAANELGEPLAQAADPTDQRWADAPDARGFLDVMRETGYEAEFEAGLALLVKGLAAQA